MAEKIARVVGTLSFFSLALIVAENYAQEHHFAGDLDIFLWHKAEACANHVRAAENLVHAGKGYEAIAEYENLLKLYPDHVPSYKRLAQLYQENHLSENAIACYEKILQLEALDTAVMKKLAQFYVASNLQKKAIPLLEKAVLLEPDSLRIHQLLAQLYHWNNMPDKLLRQYEQVIQLDSTDVQTSKKLAAYYFYKNMPLKGIKIFEKLVRANPDSLQFRKELAQQYEGNGLPQNALFQYQEIISREPTDFESTKKLAELCLANQRAAEAALLYARLTQQNPENLAYKFQLASAYSQSDQYKKAEQPLKEILNQQPYHKEAALWLAKCQLGSGSWDLAKQSLEKLQRLDPHNEVTQQLLTDIRQQFGLLPQIRYVRVEDSNLLTQEQIPLSATYFFNRSWEFIFLAARHSLKDGRTDSLLVGYGSQLSATYNLSSTMASTVELAITDYSSNWSPVSFNIQVNKKLFDRLSTNLCYYRSEARTGITALTTKIKSNGFAGEYDWQISKRWNLSGQYSSISYSDKNHQIKAKAESNIILKVNNPRMSVYGSYSFEDFKRIYSNTLPYWTPDKLVTSSVGLKLSQQVSRWLRIGAGYASAKQSTFYANNFIGELGIRFARFGAICFQYLEKGSRLYRTKNILFYLQYHF